MIILGIETSCDETSTGIIEVIGKTRKITLLSNVVATSLALHSKTGGIIPEIAAREQIKYMLPVLDQALQEAFQLSIPPIDAISVTYGPGLIGSLLVGVETARTLSYIWKKPLIPVNHMLGHIYANWIGEKNIEFPAIALVVSGGHTDLLLLKNHKDITLLGGTRDDAAGEAFDKIARLLGLPYPGGPVIERLAKMGNAKQFRFPRPLWDSGDYDFSFSGLKTAVLRVVINLSSSLSKEGKLDGETVNNIAASVLEAVVDVLTNKTLRAVRQYQVKSLLLAGGVAANQTLKEKFEAKITEQQLPVQLFVPDKNLCTDNGAMIAAAAYFNYHPIPWQDITPDPELYFE